MGGSRSSVSDIDAMWNSGFPITASAWTRHARRGAGHHGRGVGIANVQARPQSSIGVRVRPGDRDRSGRRHDRHDDVAVVPRRGARVVNWSKGGSCEAAAGAGGRRRTPGARHDLLSASLPMALRPVDVVVLADERRPGAARAREDSFDVVFSQTRGCPTWDGLALAECARRFADRRPALVFVSAYEDGAVDVFEHDLRPLDYLMKPVSRRRVGQALQRAQASVGENAHRPRSSAGCGAVCGPRPCRRNHRRDRPCRAPARRDHAAAATVDDPLRQGRGRLRPDPRRQRQIPSVRAALSDVEQRWGQYGFVRASQLCREPPPRGRDPARARGGATVVLVDGSQVPVARRQVADLRRRLRM